MNVATLTLHKHVPYALLIKLNRGKRTPWKPSAN